MEFSGAIDRDLLKELGKHLMPKRQRRILLFSICLCFVLFVTGLAADIFFLKVLGGIGFPVFLAEYFLIRNRIVKVNAARMEELYGKAECRFRISLEESSLKYENLYTGGCLNMQYDSFVRMAETAHLYVLITKGNQFITFTKEEMTKERETQMLQMIHSKCRNLK